MVRTSNLDRGTAMGYLARHPLILLPSNVTNNWASVQAAAGLTATTYTVFPTRTAFGVNGGAVGNVTVNITTPAGFVSTMTLSIEVSGKDENFNPVTEIINCVGNGSATAFAGQQLFSEVGVIRYASIGAVAFSGSGASVLIGSGDGVSTSATILIPNLFPTLPASSISLIANGANPNAAASYIAVPSAALPDGKGGFRAWRCSTNYGTAATVRLAHVVITGQTAEGVEL